jgi:SpoVK/Ycf46/Vps4 family AAA+-type ATPase
MTALYAIYGRLFEGASVDVVVYSASLPAGKFVVISDLSPPKDCSVVLRLDSKRSHLTASNDILTHPWVLDTLGISDGNHISVSFFNECIVQSDESLNINMSFVQTISYKHWDEVCITSISDLIKGGNSYLWPSSIDKQLFCKLLPSLLTGKYIRSGMIVPVAYLDSILLFKVNSIAQVDSISPDHNVYLLKHSQSINISCDFIQSTSIATADHPAVAEDAFEKEIKDYSACMSDSYIATQFYKVMNICSQVLHSNRQWKGCRSALVTAIEGGGKSYFLKLVKYSTVKAAYINECSYRNASHIVSKELVVLTITAATLRKVETEVDCTSFNQYTQDVNVKIAALLQQLCMLLQVPITANMLAPTTPILLLIDDIADFYRDPDDEESAGSRTADDSAIALILKDLLHLVNNESLAWRVVVISTARITPGATKRMAATNSLQTYFKHEIVVSLQKPSSNDRKVIIEALLRRNNHFQLENIAEEGGGSDDDVVKVWSAKLALITTGYVPGDIVTLVKRLSNATSTPVLWRSALELLSTMPPKQLTLIDQGSAVQQEKTLTWDNFGGYRPQKESIMKLFRAFQHVKEANNELLQQIYSKLPRGIVLYGPSGCGKTYMARVIASVSNMNFVSVKSTDILSKYYGQTEEVLRSIFSKARSAAPCILFFDEFDTIACKREISDQNSDGTGSVYNRILSTFLNELDGICNRGDSSGSSFEREVLVVTACLDITQLDEALIRPGRLHYHILLEKPTYDDVVDILELEIKRNNSSAYNDTVDIPLIATSIMRTSPSSSTVVSLCKQAIAYALREAITSQRELETVPGELNSKSIKVSQTHFSQVLRAQNAL